MSIAREGTALTLLVVLALTAGAGPALGAVGCDLNNPDRDVPRLYPGATGYKTLYASLGQRGVDPVFDRVEARLGGSKYATLFAPLDISYTIYEIYDGDRKLGYIHGVNQKGQFGGIQVFLAQDLRGVVRSFYIQKMSGPAARKLRDGGFAAQFAGATLEEFGSFDLVSGKGTGRFADLRNPVPEMETDFYGVLRGVKKNLVLMDEFVFSRERAGR